MPITLDVPSEDMKQHFKERSEFYAKCVVELEVAASQEPSRVFGVAGLKGPMCNYDWEIKQARAKMAYFSLLEKYLSPGPHVLTPQDVERLEFVDPRAGISYPETGMAMDVNR